MWLIDALGTVDELMALLARGRVAFDDPGLDVLAHCVQCAQILRRERPDDDELIAAGLVHDIADVAFPSDHADHDRRGAALVAPLLGARVAHLVGAHVVAKRYLVRTEPAYRARLSARSAETLQDQGDVLDDEALQVLAADPDLDAIVALRRADERAKRRDAPEPQLDDWRELLDRVARRATG